MTTTAKLFKNGRSQAVRLPREFRFEGDRSGFVVPDEGCSWSRCSRTSRRGSPNSIGWPPSPSCRKVGSSHHARRDVFDDDVPA